MSMLNQLTAVALLYADMFNVNGVQYEYKMEELRQEWRDSMKLPRKKKKAARKRILADMQFYTDLNNWQYNL